MKATKFIVSEGAYLWAESIYEKQKVQKTVDLDFVRMVKLLEKGEAENMDVFFFESHFKNKLPLMLLENVMPKKKKAKILVYKITYRSYHRFKCVHYDILQLFLMHGRMAYLKEYSMDRADPPTFIVDPSDDD